MGKNALIITAIGGFVPQFEMNDVKILQELGYSIHYASDFENPVYEINQEKLEEQGIVLHHISIRKSPWRIKENTKAFRELKNIIKREDIGLIHCHNPMGGVAGRLAAKCSRKRPYVIYTAHGFHFYKGAPLKNWLLYYPAERFLARYTDLLITVNREDYRKACGFRLSRRGRVAQIPGVGVDLKRFWPQPASRERMRERLRIPKGAFHIVSVGELNENKNHETVIRALAKLQDEGIYYSICGKGEHRKWLEELVCECHLEARVRLLGYRNDVDMVLQSADCFAFPSKREGFGIAAIEAMACGIPVIAADNRGTREYMRHGENGIMCKATSPEEFGSAIIKLKENPALCKRYGDNCRDTAMDFSIERTDFQMRKIYGEVL